jgi:hypothetical protein
MFLTLIIYSIPCSQVLAGGLKFYNKCCLLSFLQKDSSIMVIIQE